MHVVSACTGNRGESSCKQIYSSPPSPPPTALRLLLLETSGCHEDSYRRVSSKLEVGAGN